MTVAAHITSDKENVLSFLSDHLPVLASKNLDDHFIFFTDKIYPPATFKGGNITQVLISPQIKNSLLLYYWYNYKLPALLKKYNATRVSNALLFMYKILAVLFFKSLSPSNSLRINASYLITTSTRSDEI